MRVWEERMGSLRAPFWNFSCFPSCAAGSFHGSAVSESTKHLPDPAEVCLEDLKNKTSVTLSHFSSEPLEESCRISCLTLKTFQWHLWGKTITINSNLSFTSEGVPQRAVGSPDSRGFCGTSASSQESKLCTDYLSPHEFPPRSRTHPGWRRTLTWNRP